MKTGMEEERLGQEERKIEGESSERETRDRECGKKWTGE